MTLVTAALRLEVGVVTRSSRAAMNHATNALAFLGRTAAVIIGIVLAVAGGSKLLDVPAFRESLEHWSTVPWFLKEFVAISVPVAETVVGLMILLRLRERAALIGAAALLTVFTSGIIMQLFMGEMVGCRCFGTLLVFRETQDSVYWMLWRNGALLVIVVCAIVTCHKRELRSPREQPVLP